MQIFEHAEQLKAEVESKRRGTGTLLNRATVSPPHLGGQYRNKDNSYTLNLDSPAYPFSSFAAKRLKKDKVEQHKVEVPVIGLTGTFIMTYCASLAFCLLAEHNAEIHEANEGKKDSEKAPFVPYSIYLIAAVIANSGFTVEEYSQGKVQGAKRIRSHFLAVANRQGIDMHIDDEGVITGLDYSILNDILECA